MDNRSKIDKLREMADRGTVHERKIARKKLIEIEEALEKERIQELQDEVNQAPDPIDRKTFEQQMYERQQKEVEEIQKQFYDSASGARQRREQEDQNRRIEEAERKRTEALRKRKEALKVEIQNPPYIPCDQNVRHFNNALSSLSEAQKIVDHLKQNSSMKNQEAYKAVIVKINECFNLMEGIRR